jgi:rubrerythrin
MPGNEYLNKAIKNSLFTEKNAMDFYRIAAEKAQDTEVKKVFELLASEEREHAKSFFKLYKGGDFGKFDDFIDTPPDKGLEWVKGLEQMILEIGFDERHALELAMKKEQELEEHLRKMCERVVDPEAKAVYKMNAESTHNHYEVIESEYARLMRMVHETDVDTYVRE